MKTPSNLLRVVVIVVLAVLSTGKAGAQDAKQLLKEVSQKVRSYDNIAIDFKYNLENPRENVQQEARGDVTLKGDSYLLNMMGATRMFDGKKVYSISPEDEEVTISSVDQADENEITPSKMLTFYEKGYTYKMDITQNVKGRKIQFVRLTPIDSNAEIKNILLGIDAQTKHIYKLIQTDENGTRYTITVNSFKTNQPLSQTLFIFNEQKYKDEGYYINRLD